MVPAFILPVQNHRYGTNQAARPSAPYQDPPHGYGRRQPDHLPHAGLPRPENPVRNKSDAQTGTASLLPDPHSPRTEADSQTGTRPLHSPPTRKIPYRTNQTKTGTASLLPASGRLSPLDRTRCRGHGIRLNQMYLHLNLIIQQFTKCLRPFFINPVYVRRIPGQITETV